MTTDPAAKNRTTRVPLATALPPAIEAAGVLAERVKGRDAQLRRSFIRRGQSEQPTPMMSMLRGGRGGEVRLKLYLSLLWIAVAPPHNVSYPARTWASLLGLPEPSGKGARRVNEALAWLEAENFVRMKSSRGVPPVVTVLDEGGSGHPYTLPGPTIKRLQEAEKAWNRHAYEKVPVELWTNGWMAALTGPALACLLVLRSAPPSPDGSPNLASWFSPTLLKDRYNMSDDTRLRGMRGLEELGLVTSRQSALARTSVDFQRYRTEYTLRPGRLQSPPVEKPAPDAEPTSGISASEMHKILSL